MMLLPFLLLGAVAVVLGLRYEDLPDRLVANWGPQGPDRWVEKSWRSVLGVPIIGFAVLGLLAMARSGLQRADVPTDWHRRLQALHSRLVLALSFCTALLFCNIALAPLGRPATMPVSIWIALAPTFVIVIWALYRQFELQSEPGAPSDIKLKVPNQWQLIAYALALPLVILLVAA